MTNISKEEKRGYEEILKAQRESFRDIKIRISKNILDIDEDFELYRRLGEENSSPYMFLIKYKDFSIIGASPESLVSVNRSSFRKKAFKVLQYSKGNRT
ncbi:MAG: chorismate-binding protein [Clostridium sp.]|uniref:chorismate-binding protein n=1 Tax=Clostridium sp. TaxID=1506 RepID=UPI003EE819D2